MSKHAAESSWPRAATLPLKSEAEPQAPGPKIVFLSQNWSNGRLLVSPRFNHGNSIDCQLPENVFHLEFGALGPAAEIINVNPCVPKNSWRLEEEVMIVACLDCNT